MPVHPPPIDLIALRLFGEQYESRGFSLCTFLQPPVPCSLARSTFFLSILFPNTTNPCFSLQVEDQSEHPGKSTGKMTLIDLCILFTVFHTANGKTTDSDPTVAGIPLSFIRV
jgi:hypothetical protein